MMTWNKKRLCAKVNYWDDNSRNICGKWAETSIMYDKECSHTKTYVALVTTDKCGYYVVINAS